MDVQEILVQGFIAQKERWDLFLGLIKSQKGDKTLTSIFHVPGQLFVQEGSLLDKGSFWMISRVMVNTVW